MMSIIVSHAFDFDHAGTVAREPHHNLVFIIELLFEILNMGLGVRRLTRCALGVFCAFARWKSAFGRIGLDFVDARNGVGLQKRFGEWRICVHFRV
jgi:hypothetical protein